MSEPLIYGYFLRINDAPTPTVETSMVYRGDFGNEPIRLSEFRKLWDSLTHGHAVMYSRFYVDPGHNRFI